MANNVINSPADSYNRRYMGFPDPFATSEEKSQKKYGIDYAKAIWGNYNLSDPNAKIDRFILNRKYAEGLQSVDKYKDRLDIKGDTSYLNLDFNPPPIIPKFVDIILGRLMNQIYKIQCNPIDPNSKVKQDKDRLKMKINMKLKPFSERMKSATGISIIPENEYVPESDDEAELYMDTNYKQAISMAMEEAMEVVMNNNDFKNIEKKVLRDLIVVKMAAIKNYYDENKQIRTDYVDVVDLIYPYSKYDDFSNIPYIGLRKKVTIQQLNEMTDEFSDQDLYNIAKQNAGVYGNRNWTYGDSYEGYYRSSPLGMDYSDFNVTMLDFEFITPKIFKWQKRPVGDGSTSSLISEKEDFKLSAGQQQKRKLYEKKVNVKYKGNWIVGTDYIFGYSLVQNMLRDKKNGIYSSDTPLSIKIIAPNIYDMENKSTVERMIPFADQIALCHLKMQQVATKIKPPGVAIDTSGLDMVVSGMGQGKTLPTDIMEMYNQTGNYQYSSKRDDGSSINNAVVTPLSNEVGSQMRSLIELYNYNLNMIRDVTGVNEVADASTPNSEALVGVQKLALQATSNALRELNQAYVDLVKRSAKDLTLMIQDSISNKNDIYGFDLSIGKYATETIEMSKQITLAEFGIEIEFLPDEEEKAELSIWIQRALDSQEIRIEDAIMIKQIMKKNVKLAAQHLIHRKKKYLEERMEENQANIQEQAEANSRSAQEAEAAKALGEQSKLQSEAQYLQIEYDLKSKLSAQEHQQKLREIQMSNIGKVQQTREANTGKIVQTTIDNNFKKEEGQKTPTQ